MVANKQSAGSASAGPSAPPPGPTLHTPTGFLIVRVAEWIERAFTAQLHAVGLTGRELHVLRYLAATGPISHGELSSGVSVDAANLIDVVDRLEQAGLIDRTVDPRDRRRRRLTLTRRGARRLDAGLRAAAQAESDVLGSLDAERLALLRAMMQDLYEDRDR